MHGTPESSMKEVTRAMDLARVNAPPTSAQMMSELRNSEARWLERLVGELAETFERRAHEWENPGEHGKYVEGGDAFAQLYREMSEDIRAALAKLPNTRNLPTRTHETL